MQYLAVVQRRLPRAEQREEARRRRRVARAAEARHVPLGLERGVRRARGVRARQEAGRAERARHRLQRDEGCVQQARARDEVGVRMHDLRTWLGVRG